MAEKQRGMSITEKADAFDRLIKEIRYRAPSVDLAFAQRGAGWLSRGPKGDEITRFLAAFDALAGVVKRHQLGDDKVVDRIRRSGG